MVHKREMAVESCRRFVEEQIILGNLLGTMHINFFTADPEWDPNVPIFRQR